MEALSEALTYRSVSTFFGLTLEYRKSLFKQIHEIVFHGQGGYDHDTVYGMPIWLRNYTFRTIQKYYEDQKKEQDKNIAKAKGTSHKPSKPTYTVKARK